MGGGKADRRPINAWIGEEIVVTGGTVTFEGVLRVDGRVRDAQLVGQGLIVGERARVAGRIEVDELAVHGTLEGTAVVRRSAVISPGGAFRGEMILERPVLEVQEGGTFEGRVRTVRRPDPESGTLGIPDPENREQGRKGTR